MNRNPHQTTDRPEIGETNGLIDGPKFHEEWDKKSKGRKLDWSDPELARITRFRLLSDPGFPFWDVSYILGVTHDGENVDVYNPFSQLPKRGMKRHIIECAKRDGVYAKGLGIFDAISTLC